MRSEELWVGASPKELAYSETLAAAVCSGADVPAAWDWPRRVHVRGWRRAGGRAGGNDDRRAGGGRAAAGFGASTHAGPAPMRSSSCGTMTFARHHILQCTSTHCALHCSRMRPAQAGARALERQVPRFTCSPCIVSAFPAQTLHAIHGQQSSDLPKFVCNNFALFKSNSEFTEN